MSKHDVQFNMILYLEISLSSKQFELIIEILSSQIDRNDFLDAVDSFSLELVVWGLCQSWKVMLHENVMINAVVLLECDISDWYFRLNKFDVDIVDIINGIIVCYYHVEFEVIWFHTNFKA